MADGIQFYMDEHVQRAVTQGLRRRGVDVLTVQEAELLGVSDTKHLTRANTERRVIFTQDTDFLRLHATGVSHSGIVYAVQQTPIGQIVRGLMLIYDLLDAEDMIDHVEFI